MDPARKSGRKKKSEKNTYPDEMNFLRKLLASPPNLAGLSAGRAGEEWVAYLYRQKGWQVLYQNYAVYGQKKFGEIDVICAQGRQLRIIEVKTRSAERFMNIEEAVTSRKQEYLRRMVKLFLQEKPEYQDYQIQIDVAAVLLDTFDNSVKSVKLIENAIEDSD